MSKADEALSIINVFLLVLVILGFIEATYRSGAEEPGIPLSEFIKDDPLFEPDSSKNFAKYASKLP